jgi:pimeloyl-ACP methyl ester carboxylesterase
MVEQKNKKVKKRRWPWIVAGILLLIGLGQLFTNLYKEEEKTLLSRIRKTVKEKFPEEAAEFSQTIGLFYFKTGQKVSHVTGQFNKSVVLVHGLDDPGKVWQVLAPELVKQGLDVWLLHYPNDQPVAESAHLFFNELQQLARTGTLQISIVAHSMGGLVAREMLTSPEMNYKQTTKKRQVPEVTTLIMVATPNHGSQAARFRVFGEIRDHLVRMTKGEANWLGTILDGAGEAKIDLLPGSRFLVALNARPHPKSVEMLIIAGIASPWNEDDIDQWIGKVRQKVSNDQQEQVDALGKYMISMTHGLGDGLVTVESTRLEGIPHLTVDGTHLSIIRNIIQDSHRIPPAVPIIIDRLTKAD